MRVSLVSLTINLFERKLRMSKARLMLLRTGGRKIMTKEDEDLLINTASEAGVSLDWIYIQAREMSSKELARFCERVSIRPR